MQHSIGPPNWCMPVLVLVSYGLALYGTLEILVSIWKTG
jgi:hypothetical protein